MSDDDDDAAAARQVIELALTKALLGAVQHALDRIGAPPDARASIGLAILSNAVINIAAIDLASGQRIGRHAAESLRTLAAASSVDEMSATAQFLSDDPGDDRH